ncbi:unnamed protein product [Rotaria sordida]|uniref:Uncharacterized protein n=1 Tax=Rotaria sordida TaxID=392033 RepID=A0A814UJ39_9BILA|nr:unnamed protein product [Rotaria sordida]
MDVSDDLQQSILLCMVSPSGVCSLVNHNQSIHDNNRFLYYSYRTQIFIDDVSGGSNTNIVLICANV